MTRSLPGADKYRTDPDKPAPWRHPLVERANTEIDFIELLGTRFDTFVPREAEGWKVRCPLADEHDDGGLDRQFRVWHSTNSGYCYALHGALDPVRLWRLRGGHRTLREAAQSLLDAHGIQTGPIDYREQMAQLRQDRPAFRGDVPSVVQTIQVYLSTLPGYLERQYDESIREVVNSVLSEVHTVCAEASTLEEVQRWLQQAERRLARSLDR